MTVPTDPDHAAVAVNTGLLNTLSREEAAGVKKSVNTYRAWSLDRVMEDMAGRSARFHLTLGDITRSTDASPETFLRYKHALLAHMSDFMAELDRYLPRL